MGDAIEAMKKGQSLLLDGFPRTMEQAVALDKSLDVDLVINLCIPNDTIIGRISDRWDRNFGGAWRYWLEVFELFFFMRDVLSA